MRNKVSLTIIANFRVINHITVHSLLYELFQTVTHQSLCLLLFFNRRRRHWLHWLPVRIDNRSITLRNLSPFHPGQPYNFIKWGGIKLSVIKFFMKTWPLALESTLGRTWLFCFSTQGLPPSSSYQSDCLGYYDLCHFVWPLFFSSRARKAFLRYTPNFHLYGSIVVL